MATCGRMVNGLIWRWNASTRSGLPKHYSSVSVSIKIKNLTSELEFSSKLWVDHPNTLHGDGHCLAVQEAGAG